MKKASAFAGTLAAFASALILLCAGPAPAQSIDNFRQRSNAGTVAIVSGGVEGTYVRIAADLAAVLDRGDQLRILPIIGKGSLQNISDVMFVRGIDIGIVQSDALAYARQRKLFPGIEKNIQYIAKLYNEEVHILARPEIGSLEDLKGQRVNVDLQGSGTAMTASLIFERLGIPVEAVNNDQALALEKLKRGEIAALVYVAGKPARLFRDLGGDDGLHFLAVPLSAPLLDVYLPSQLTNEDYAKLVTKEAPIETLAVGAVMAVYGWTPESERYRKVATFVDAFFSNFEMFLQPPRHAKWKEVNLAAQVPGWTRFPAAEGWLRRAPAPGDDRQKRAFEAFLTQSGHIDIARTTEQQREALYQDFLRWSRSRAEAR